MTPVRVRLSRKKGWKLPPDTVSVARPGRWGNPFSVAPELVPGTPVGTRYIAMPTVAEAVEAYRRWLEEDPAGRAIAQQAQIELRGKNLACWCPLDGPCHAGVLLEVANRAAGKDLT